MANAGVRKSEYEVSNFCTCLVTKLGSSTWFLSTGYEANKFCVSCHRGSVGSGWAVEAAEGGG